MFESDDYDQVLSQLDFPEVLKPEIVKVANQIQCSPNNSDREKTKIIHSENKSPQRSIFKESNADLQLNEVKLKTVRQIEHKDEKVTSPKHTKRKLISSHFDHSNKRKFPGPAGLLSGSLEVTKDNALCQLELLSQDIDSSQSHLQQGLFETPLWKRLLEDTKHLNSINTVKMIKQHALAGNLRRKKADIVRGFVDCIDRSAIDPLITLRDATGHIQCTLHRDAWTNFAPYIASEYCALVLQNSTVLTTGSAFKKHYLNITTSNIYLIYSSTVSSDNYELPNEFVSESHDDFTIVKRETQAGIDCSPNFEVETDELEGLDFSDIF